MNEHQKYAFLRRALATAAESTGVVTGAYVALSYLETIGAILSHLADDLAETLRRIMNGEDGPPGAGGGGEVVQGPWPGSGEGSGVAFVAVEGLAFVTITFATWYFLIRPTLGRLVTGGGQSRHAHV